nr:FAD-dependent monooxygenase [Sorangium cellulosum]
MAMDAEVVVVGGGPVGLMLACELALARVRVRVLEQRPARMQESRALTLHPRTLEILDGLHDPHDRDGAQGARLERRAGGADRPGAP